jgi:hypothetical protein
MRDYRITTPEPRTLKHTLTVSPIHMQLPRAAAPTDVAPPTWVYLQEGDVVCAVLRHGSQNVVAWVERDAIKHLLRPRTTLMRDHFSPSHELELSRWC